MARGTTAHPPELCGQFHRAAELIGRRWTGAIIFVLLKSRCRFATLRDAIPDITDRMLSERLQELESEGILERTVITDGSVVEIRGSVVWSPRPAPMPNRLHAIVRGTQCTRTGGPSGLGCRQCTPP